MDGGAVGRRLRASMIQTRRLRLEPLRLTHADELVSVLDDAALHTYIGGEPATLPQLRMRFDVKSRGCSADGLQTWLNWVVRGPASVVGYVQATLSPVRGEVVAELAWVVGVEHQRLGYAGEATAAAVAWLAARGVRHLVVHIHPDNVASQRLAARLGMHPSHVVVDGEVEWVLRRSGRPAGP